MGKKNAFVKTTGVAKSKKPTSKKKPASVDTPKHAELDKTFIALGKHKFKKSKAHFIPLPEAIGHKSDLILDMNGKLSAGGGEFNHKKFAAKYRRAWNKSDEVLSTSSVSRIVESFFSSNPTAAEVLEMNHAINDASRVRMLTKHVGYALDDGRVMQHPTSRAEAIFADPHKTASEHAAHDLARKAAGAEEVKEEMAKPASSAWSAVRASLRGTIRYTVNEMTIAASAENAGNFTKISTAQKVRMQVEDRDNLKRHYIRVGGTVAADDPNETADQAYGRRARLGTKSRELSPFRT